MKMSYKVYSYIIIQKVIRIIVGEHRWIQHNKNIDNGNDNNIFPKLAYLKVKCRTKYYKDIKDTITNTVYL